MRPGPWRWAARALAAVVALNLALALAVELVPEPGGPRSSSFATAPDGLAAYADLLASQGRPVTRRREALDDPALDPGSTVVVLDPQRLRDLEARALERFVARGGRLVIGGRDAARPLASILDDPPVWIARGVARPRVLAPVEGLAGGAPVHTAAAGAWSPAGAALPALGDGRTAVVALAARGPGRVLLLADPSPLQNRLLGSEGNAALGLALAGPKGRRVVFAERAHGFEAATGLAALPARWKVTLAGLVLAALLLVASRWRRFGPVRPPDPLFAQPPRRDYVEALAGALARTRRPGEVAEPVRAAARRALVARTMMPTGGGPDAVATAGLRAGLTADEAAAVAAPVRDEEGLIAATAALAKLERRAAA